MVVASGRKHQVISDIIEISAKEEYDACADHAYRRHDMRAPADGSRVVISHDEIPARRWPRRGDAMVMDAADIILPRNSRRRRCLHARCNSFSFIAAS